MILSNISFCLAFHVQWFIITFGIKNPFLHKEIYLQVVIHKPKEKTTHLLYLQKDLLEPDHHAKTLELSVISLAFSCFMLCLKTIHFTNLYGPAFNTTNENSLKIVACTTNKNSLEFVACFFSFFVSVYFQIVKCFFIWLT